MADLTIPELSSVKFRQLALEEGRQQLLQKQQQEQEDDRWFKGQLQILNMPEMPTAARMQAGNAILQKMKMPVQLTEEMLNPFNAVMKQYTALSQKGGDTSVLQPAIEVLLKQGAMAPGQVPQAVSALEQINTRAAERATAQAVQPELDALTTAKQWMQANGERVQQARARLQPGAPVTSDMSREDAAGLDAQAKQYEATIGMEQAFEQRRSRYVQAFKNPAFRQQFEQQKVARELKIGSSLDDIRWRVLDMDANGGPKNENEERFYQSATAMLGFNRPSQAEQAYKEREAAYDLQKQASTTATQLVTAPYMQPVKELEGQLQKVRQQRKLNATPDEAAKYMQEEAGLWQPIMQATERASQEAGQSIQVFQSSLEQTQQQIVNLTQRMKSVPTAQGLLLKQELMQLQNDAKFYDKMMTTYAAAHPAKQASVRYQLENLEQDLKDSNAPDYAENTQRAEALRTSLQTMERDWTALTHQVAAHDVQVAKRGEALSLQRAKYAKEQDVKKATNELAAYVMDHMDEGYTAALSAGRKLFPSADLGEADKMVKSIRQEAAATNQFDAEAMYLARREAHPKETEEVSLAFVAKAMKDKGAVVEMKKVREALQKSPLVSVDLRGETKEAQTVGEGFGKEYLSILNAGQMASTKLAKLDRMTTYLDGITTGKLTPAITELQAIGESFGLKVDSGLPAKQALESLANEIALQLRNPSGGAGMPGALSDKDREFLQSMTPGLSKTLGGNRLIIDTARLLAKRDQEVAKMARAYRKEHKHLDEGFFDQLQEYSDANPLFKAPQAAPAGWSMQPTGGWSIKPKGQ